MASEEDQHLTEDNELLRYQLEAAQVCHWYCTFYFQKAIKKYFKTEFPINLKNVSRDVINKIRNSISARCSDVRALISVSICFQAFYIFFNFASHARSVCSDW